jgi:hypothetical protein
MTLFKKISLYVLGAHFLLLLILLSQHLLTRPFKYKPIAVRTVHIARTPPPPPVAAIKQPAKSSPTPAKKPSVIAKSASPKKKSPAPSQKLLQDIESNLQALTSPVVKERVKTEISIPTLHIESITFEESNSTERIAAFLQDSLQLPEYGEVKVALSLDRSGKLLHLDILDSKSEKNKQFIKNRLPELQFPCLNESASLTIVFRNEN